MSIVVNTLIGMGAKLLTAAVVEKLVIYLLEELVKRSSSKADDKLLRIIQEALEK